MLSERMRNKSMRAFEYADEVAQLEAENAALREEVKHALLVIKNSNERIGVWKETHEALQRQVEGLREHYGHIKAWVNQPVGMLTIQQFMDAVTRMCDDALQGGE